MIDSWCHIVRHNKSLRNLNLGFNYVRLHSRTIPSSIYPWDSVGQQHHGHGSYSSQKTNIISEGCHVLYIVFTHDQFFMWTKLNNPLCHGIMLNSSHHTTHVTSKNTLSESNSPYHTQAMWPSRDINKLPCHHVTPRFFIFYHIMLECTVKVAKIAIPASRLHTRPRSVEPKKLRSQA